MLPERYDSPGAGAWVTRRLPAIYLVAALFVSTLLCVLTPPFGVPDETMHARREVELARGELTGRLATEGTGFVGAGGTVDSNFEIVDAAMGRLRTDFNARNGGLGRLPDGRMTAGDLAPWQGIYWSGRPAFGWFPNTAVYPPGLYLTQVAGWWVGRAAGLTIFHSLYLARLITMLCAVGIGWLAMRMCRRGRWLLCAYLLLPTTLSLGASCSQDALLMPIAGLVMVLLLRAIEEQRVLRGGELAVLGVLLWLCIGARVPYMPLALVLLLPALELPERGWRKLAPATVVMVLIAGAVGAWQLAVRRLGIFVAPESDPIRQVALLKLHPLHGVESLVESVVHEIPVTMLKGLYMLGSNDAGPSHWMYGVMLAGLVGIVLLSPMAGLKSRAAKAVLAFSLLSTVAAIWLAEYVAWTAPGALRAVGFQSRYFFPLFTLALLLGWQWVPGLARRLLRTEQTCERVRFAAGAAFLFAVLYAPFVAAHVFYLSGPVQALSFLLQ